MSQARDPATPENRRPSRQPLGAAAASAARLALGTLTVLPVRPPGNVDRLVAGWAMCLAPLVGLALGVAVSALVWGLSSMPLLGAALCLAAVAVLTRGIHLDGLADTADGLGSGTPPDQALDIMRRGDIGPFGVVAIVTTLLVDAAALAELTRTRVGPPAVVLALVASRLVLPVVCSRGVPAARARGLGKTVAGTVAPAQLIWASAAGLGGAALVLATAPWLGGLSGPEAGRLCAASLVGPTVGGLLCWRCVRRLGGVTGDVMGACVEVAFAAALVAMVLAA